jgi:hypothetical protein
MVLLVDGLAGAPIPKEEVGNRLGLDQAAVGALLEIGESSHLVKTIPMIDGDVLYSPFFGFENPELIGELVTEHGSEQLALAFATIRQEQGIPVTDAQPFLMDAVSRGLLMAPAVELPNGQFQPFAALPYALERDLLRGRKPILDKALAVLACLRCGQHYGGYSRLPASSLVNVIDKLLDPNRGFLQPHESHERQYRLMHRTGLIAFDPDTLPGGSWVTPRFIDTADNREALKIAQDLITHGQQLSGRVGDEQARQTLRLGKAFAAPMQTVARVRGKAPTSAKQWQSVIDSAMGRGRM